VLPIALRMCMEVAQVIKKEFPGRTLSGIGGIETGNDAAQFILLGCDTVQVCTGVMKAGYDIVRPMRDQLLAFMERHKFNRLEDFRGHALQFFTSHHELVERQAAARAAKKAEHARQKMIRADAEWDGDDFVQQSDALSRG
jgi:dihydropyrimidine dehydrogenase (NADP+)/dihydropyrimidine dehydrogenase (NAD+) subunit PreA